jgi:hypothetical protein
VQADYESALRVGTSLQERHYLHHIEHAEPFSASPAKLYMFLEEEAPVSSALNAGKPFLKPARSATKVGTSERKSKETKNSSDCDVVHPLAAEQCVKCVATRLLIMPRSQLFCSKCASCLLWWTSS